VQGTREHPVHFLPRHGCGHRLAPHQVNYRANIFALKAQGAQQLVSISAVGSLQEHIHPGDLVVVDQFIDRTRGRPSTFFDQDVVAHVSMALPTDAALSFCLSEVAQREAAPLHRAAPTCAWRGRSSRRAPSRYCTRASMRRSSA
jgi:5'-methylthioadenosine phosphorylase